MNIQCPACKTIYKIDLSFISEDGTKMECARCAHIFIARKKPVNKIENIIGNIKDNISKWESTTEQAETESEESQEKADILSSGSMLTEEEAADIAAGFEPETTETLQEEETKDKVDTAEEAQQDKPDAVEMKDSSADQAADLQEEETKDKVDTAEEAQQDKPDAVEMKDSGSGEAAVQESEEASSNESAAEKVDDGESDKIDMKEGEGKGDIKENEETKKVEADQDVSEQSEANADTVIEENAREQKEAEPGEAGTAPEEGTVPKSEQEQMINELVKEDMIAFDDESVKAVVGDVEEKKEPETGDKNDTESSPDAATEVIEPSQEEAVKPDDPVEEDIEEIIDDSNTMPEWLSGLPSFISSFISKLVSYSNLTIHLGKFKISGKMFGASLAGLFVIFMISMGGLIWILSPDDVTNPSQQTAMNNTMKKDPSQKQTGEEGVSQKQTVEENASTPEQEARTVKVGVILPIAYDTDEIKIMSMSLKLRLNTDEAVVEMESSPSYYYEDMLEHTISDFLGGVFYDDIPDVKDRLKNEIAVKLNNIIKNGKIESIDFEEFLVQ